MKKLLAVFVLLSLVLFSAGCGSSPVQATPAPTQAAEASPEATQDAEASPAAAAAPEAVSAQTAAEEAPAEPAQENKSLIVVFSCTGTTKGIAEKIAALTGAELVDLVPAQPYTAEDLNYNDRSTRATVEQNTPDARPEIANDISLDGVTTLYLGYPIWWGQAPASRLFRSALPAAAARAAQGRPWANRPERAPSSALRVSAPACPTRNCKAGSTAIHE